MWPPIKKNFLNKKYDKWLTLPNEIRIDIEITLNDNFTSKLKTKDHERQNINPVNGRMNVIFAKLCKEIGNICWLGGIMIISVSIWSKITPIHFVLCVS